MAEAPEIPEAKDPFEKHVALTIAILAICLSFIGNMGDNAKTDAIVKTNHASNQWGYFQAKSIKGQLAEMQGDLLGRLNAPAPDQEKLRAEAERYDGEKAEIKKQAEAFQVEAEHQSAINDRCDLASVLLQIAVIICSVAILAASHRFWWAGMALGAAGVIASVSALFV